MLLVIVALRLLQRRVPVLVRKMHIGRKKPAKGTDLPIRARDCHWVALVARSEKEDG